MSQWNISWNAQKGCKRLGSFFEEENEEEE